MRVGQNPAKNIDYVKKPENITVAIITYIPFLSGYYEQSLDILKICLNSLLENTTLPFDLMVFDNASCTEVKDYLIDLQNQGKIQYLTLSDNNIGKGGGWNFIFNAAPGEYIAYADADIEFKKGWLSDSIKVIDTFPNVGMVTGRPLRTPTEHFTSVLEWADDNNQRVEIRKGNFVNWETFKEHTISCGTSEELSLEWYKTSEDFLIIYNDVEAYGGAAHFQFSGRKDVLQKFLPFNMDRPMGQVRRLDKALNEKGKLRLSITKPLVKHLGNKILPAAFEVKSTNKYRFSIFNIKIIKKILLYVYNKLFSIYFDSGK